MESMQNSLDLKKHGIQSTTKERCTVCNYGMVITVVTNDGELSRCKYCDDKKVLAATNIPKTRAEYETMKTRNRARYFNRIPTDLENVTLNEYAAESDDQKEIRKIAVDFIINFEKGKSLVMSGDPGVGKSHIAVSIAKALSSDYSTLFLKSTDVLALVKESFDSEKHSESDVFNIIKDVDVLVLDDIGAEYEKKNEGESWASDVLFRILDSRLGKSIVITTNYSTSELINKYGMNGKRIESRMNDNAKLMRIFGKDGRKNVSM